MTTPSTLYTIGYEGHDAASFVARLADHDIDVLVDVRENPISRKKGFSKRQLESNLAEAGIRYEHVRALGNPSEIRKGGGGTKAVLKRYAEHMDDRWDLALEPVQALLEAGAAPALMCLEKAPSACHRSVVVDALRVREPGLRVVHL